MRTKLKRINSITLSNAVEPATTSGKTWGFYGVPGKGGETLNAAIIPKPDARFTPEEVTI